MAKGIALQDKGLWEGLGRGETKKASEVPGAGWGRRGEAGAGSTRELRYGTCLFFFQMTVESSWCVLNKRAHTCIFKRLAWLAVCRADWVWWRQEWCCQDQKGGCGTQRVRDVTGLISKVALLVERGGRFGNYLPNDFSDRDFHFWAILCPCGAHRGQSNNFHLLDAKIKNVNTGGCFASSRSWREFGQGKWEQTGKSISSNCLSPATGQHYKHLTVTLFNSFSSISSNVFNLESRLKQNICFSPLSKAHDILELFASCKAAL